MFLVQPFQSNNLEAEYILGRLPVHHRNTQECSWPPALMAPFPLSQLWACGKRLKNSSNPPTKRDRGRPAFTPAPTAASPGPASAVVLLRSLKPIFPLPRLRRLLLLRSSHNLPCFIHLVHEFSPELHIFFYSAPPGVRLQFCHISISSSPLRQRSTRCLAPPTDIHHCNARPGSSLRVRCITSFSFLNCFLIHMPFKHTVSHSSFTFR
ncbi:hypothetical protein ATANTOWER_018274 [Ataeniobius toweri]|uniref:Uncharacterized protein n=1 Tax=Ataeniobius toweri TaxID=208326 RepID=A0ABU7AQE5_9TELE|nr:hypothetical protein [Ataeniobius toweri]